MWFFHFITRISTKQVVSKFLLRIMKWNPNNCLHMQLKNDITVYRYGVSHHRNIRNVWSYSKVYYTCLFIRWKKNAKLSLKFVLDWKFVEIFIRKTFLKKTIWRSWLERINLLCWPSIFHLHRVIFKLVIYSHWLQTCHSIKNVLFCFDLHFLK